MAPTPSLYVISRESPRKRAIDVADRRPKRISFSMSTNSAWRVSSRTGDERGTAGRTLVALAEDLREVERALDALRPQLRLERELDLRAALRDGRQLEEVARDDDLRGAGSCEKTASACGAWNGYGRVQTWMPPKGSVFLRRMLPMRASLSKRSPSTIDTGRRSHQSACTLHRKDDEGDVPSSMMSTLVRSQRVLAFLFLRIFFARSSALSMPSPMPAKEWIVTPPMLHAAMPVAGGWERMVSVWWRWNEGTHRWRQ